MRCDSPGTTPKITDLNGAEPCPCSDVPRCQFPRAGTGWDWMDVSDFAPMLPPAAEVDAGGGFEPPTSGL